MMLHYDVNSKLSLSSAITSVFDVEIRESAEELKALLSSQTNARTRDRVRALYLRQTCLAQTRRELAALLGCNESTIYRWFCTYRSEGLAGLLLLIPTPPGKPSKLPPIALEGLRVRLQERRGFQSYGEIQDWLATQYGVKAAYATVHGIVRYKLKSKLKAPRPLSIEADQQLQDTFKKTAPVSTSHGDYLGRGQHIRYFCEDESRFGMKTLLSRVITLFGVKPNARRAVEPKRIFGSMVRLNQRPESISSMSSPILIVPASNDLLIYLPLPSFDSLNLLQLDRASCHIATNLVWPENVPRDFSACSLSRIESN